MSGKVNPLRRRLLAISAISSAGALVAPLAYAFPNTGGKLAPQRFIDPNGVNGDVVILFNLVPGLDPPAGSQRIVQTLIKGGGELLNTSSSYAEAYQRVRDFVTLAGLPDTLFCAVRAGRGPMPASVSGASCALITSSSDRQHTAVSRVLECRGLSAGGGADDPDILATSASLVASARPLGAVRMAHVSSSWQTGVLLDRVARFARVAADCAVRDEESATVWQLVATTFVHDARWEGDVVS